MTCATKRIFAGMILVGLLWCGVAAEAQGLPEGEGKAAVEAACPLCHAMSYITQSSRTELEWRDIVSDMVARGSPLTTDELEEVIQYLTAYFGPKSASIASTSHPTPQREPQAVAVPAPAGR